MPGLGVFCRAALGSWAEAWLKHLVDKGLKYSTRANYRNSPARAATRTTPSRSTPTPTAPSTSCCARSQCESQAKAGALLAARPEWPRGRAQRARVKAEAGGAARPEGEPSRSGSSSRCTRRSCPTALARRLPGHDLRGDGYARHDQQQDRAPRLVVTSLSALLTEPLDLYLVDPEADSAERDALPLHPPTHDALPAGSQWTVVKAAFRSTRARPATQDAARVLHHLVDAPRGVRRRPRRCGTRGDAAVRPLRQPHDRLQARASQTHTPPPIPFVDFRESHPLVDFRHSRGGAVLRSTRSPWRRGGQGRDGLGARRGAAASARSRMAVRDGRRPCTAGWLDAFSPGCTLRFPCVRPHPRPPLQAPTRPSSARRSPSPPPSTPPPSKASFTVTSLMMRPAAPPEEAAARTRRRRSAGSTRASARLHGEQAAAVGAAVGDDVFGAATSRAGRAAPRRRRGALAHRRRLVPQVELTRRSRRMAALGEWEDEKRSR